MKEQNYECCFLRRVKNAQFRRDIDAGDQQFRAGDQQFTRWRSTLVSTNASPYSISNIHLTSAAFTLFKRATIVPTILVVLMSLDGQRGCHERRRRPQFAGLNPMTETKGGFISLRT